MEPDLSQKQACGLEHTVADAIRNTEKERDWKADQGGPGDSDLAILYSPVIRVAGVGGAGNNTVNRLYNLHLDEAEIVGINTDKQHLDVIKADIKIMIGKSLCRGLGAGGFSEVGRRVAEPARSTFQEVFKDTDVLFLTAGIGGGTGSGASPVVAEVVKQQGGLVVALVSTPFNVELLHGVKVEPSMSNLRKASDLVVTIDLNILLDYVPNLPLEQAYSVTDQLISETVKGFSQVLTKPSLVDLDFADFKAVVSGGGDAVMLVGECRSHQMHEMPANMAMTHPLSRRDFRNAKKALIHVNGGPEMTVKDAETIVESLTDNFKSDLQVAWGASCDKDYEGKARVTAILTGIEKGP